MYHILCTRAISVSSQAHIQTPSFAYVTTTSGITKGATIRILVGAGFLFGNKCFCGKNG